MPATLQSSPSAFLIKSPKTEMLIRILRVILKLMKTGGFITENVKKKNMSTFESVNIGGNLLGKVGWKNSLL